MLFQVTLIENGRHMAVEMDNLTTLVEDLHVEFNKTQAVTEQNDGERIDHQEELKKNIDMMADKVISSIDRNSNNFMTKVRECQFNSLNLQKVPLHYYNQTHQHFEDVRHNSQFLLRIILQECWDQPHINMRHIK